jgi:hypothetical protein
MSNNRHRRQMTFADGARPVRQRRAVVTDLGRWLRDEGATQLPNSTVGIYKGGACGGHCRGRCSAQPSSSPIVQRGTAGTLANSAYRTPARGPRACITDVATTTSGDTAQAT